MSLVKNKIKKSKVITKLQKEYYERDGFLILKNFIPKEICQFLVNRAQELINNFDETSIRTIFSTKDPQHVLNQYFLDSGDKIRFFFEEKALDEHGNLVAEKQYSINKIGHALHDLDPVFNLFSRQYKIAKLAHDLEIIKPLLLQSMYICKQPNFGGEVICHQDSTYLYVEDQPVTGLWFALEDATLDNGCLWAIPGGHKTPLKSRMLRNKDRCTTLTYDDTPWPIQNLIPLEVPQGSLIVLHGLLPHMSKENISARSRHAYVLHVMSGKTQFAPDNWLQRSEDNPFTGFIN